MLFPAGTGSGASDFEIVRTGFDVTVVVIATPATGVVSLESTLKVALVMTVPFASGLAVCTTFFFNDTATAEIYPLSLHDALPVCVPPPVADTNEVFAGTVSVMTTPVALALPVFEYDSV